MGKINILSFAVANLIAAGEVVDRPASAIKEMMENSIDAGATQVTVEIQNGGITFMRVSDNGSGIDVEDLPKTVRRHATSKIREADDLEKIITLGFRGEALAAISSVSNMRIISRTAESDMGAMLEVSCGDIIGITERGCSVGTTVIVENLFENVPARRKFLKRDVTEAMAVMSNVEKIALSHPEVAIRLISDGVVKLDTSGDGRLQSAIYSVFGRDFAKRMIEVNSDNDGIGVAGYIGRSDNVKGNRNYQNFFLNGRYVKSRTAAAAIEQAFVSFIPPEKYPVCVLNININPMAVDVNVHPAKLEVKFSNEKAVFEAVYYTVRAALEANKDRPNFEFTQQVNIGVRKPEAGKMGIAAPAVRVSELSIPVEEAVRGESAQKRQLTMENLGFGNVRKGPQPLPVTAEEYVRQYVERTFATSESAAETEVSQEKASYDDRIAIVADEKEAETEVAVEHNDNETAIPEHQEMNHPDVSAQASNEATPPAQTAAVSYRIVGEVFNCYIIVELEMGEKFLLVDKHAAHERINFERLKAGMNNDDPHSQLLMLPIDVMLTSDEVQTIELYRKEIEALGFLFTSSRNSVSVTAIPLGIKNEDVGDMITTIADRLKNGTGSAGLTRDILFEKALYQASCKAAIKGGREYPPEYTEWLISKLMELPDITVCPHGRPVAMELTKKYIDRQFLRT